MTIWTVIAAFLMGLALGLLRGQFLAAKNNLLLTGYLKALSEEIRSGQLSEREQFMKKLEKVRQETK